MRVIRKYELAFIEEDWRESAEANSSLLLDTKYMEYKSGPEKGLDRKLNQWEKSGISAQIGGLMHDSVAIATTRLSKLKAGLDTREEYQEEIQYWLDTLLKMAKKKVEYESIPIVEDIRYVPLTEEQIKAADDKFQEHYDKQSQLDDINLEGKL